MKITYYAVVASTAPFKNQKQLYCSTTEQTAMKVCDFVRNAFMKVLKDGIKVSVEKCKDNVVSHSGGFRLEKTPNGVITLIHEKVTRRDIQEILKLPFYDEKLLLTQKDQITQGEYHCVIAQVCPWTDETKTKIGYYTSSDTAQKVVEFIRDFYTEEMNGGVEVYVMKLTGQMLEVSSYISLEEYRRLANLTF